MKYFLLALTLVTQLAIGDELYQCEATDGSVSYQDRPCESGTQSIQVNENKNNFSNDAFKKELIRVLTKLTGKSEEELTDPKVRQAAEALAATDAAKSYAYTKVYGVSAKYCGDQVKRDLADYEAKAADIIALGRHYYANGIHIEVGGKNLSKSGHELTESLNKMIARLEAEHSNASAHALSRKCMNASKALHSLAMLYAE